MQDKEENISKKEPIKRSIDIIRFPKNGSVVDVNSLLRKYDEDESELHKMRYRIEQGIQSGSAEFVCYYCEQPVKLISFMAGVRIFYFQHVRNSGTCPVKCKKSRLSEARIRALQFKGAQESREHRELKESIGNHLRMDKAVLDVRVESVHRHCNNRRRWRRPDIFARLSDKEIVIEIQRSRTFLSTVVGRENYYRENNIYLLWVFVSFSTEKSGQTFIEKDICYNHLYNIFVFDDEAQRISRELSELVLACYHKKFYLDGGVIRSYWEKDFIGIHDLIYDTNHNVYYYDSEKEKQILEHSLSSSKNNPSSTT